MVDVGEETFQMLQKVIRLQEEREHALKLFEEGYKIYIANQPSCNLSKFRQLVKDSTKDFKRITDGILNVAQQLRHEGYVDMADIIVSLQEEENNRLQLSVKLQIAKQEAKEHSEILSLWTKVASLKDLHNRSIQAINGKMERLRYQAGKIDY